MNALSMTKEQYVKAYASNVSLKKTVKHDSWRLSYHIMPEIGWLNDPNGLCQYHGQYHIYYQYSPFDVDGKVKLWGHTTTYDFLHFKQEEPVLFPDHRYDIRGVYSGSAFLENDQIHFFYTGNVKLMDQEDYDYIQTGREQNTIHITSPDGYHMDEKKCVLQNKDYPSDMSCHVRDPKIYACKDHYKMVLGARNKQDKGCVLVYTSKDLSDWKYQTSITTCHSFGYMWECPDMFDVDGKSVLITCPQGVKQDGNKYQSVYTCGYFFLKDCETTPSIISDFVEMDAGFDFYAPQTFCDEKGRRILIGWMGMPDIPYTNPTVEKGWQHALTMPRELFIKNDKLCQRPLEEMKQLRCDTLATTPQSLGELDLKSRVFELIIEIQEQGDFTLLLRNHTKLQYQNNCLILSLQEEGYGREIRRVSLSSLHHLHIFSDTSSLEIFINDGEQVMTTRVYEKESIEKLAFLDCQMKANVVCYKLQGYIFE